MTKHGLTRYPFGTDTDQRFFFSFTALEQALSVMRRLIQGKESVTLVIGERGSGKTTFLNAYLQTANENWQRCKVKSKIIGAGRKKTVAKVGRRKLAYVCRETDIPTIIIDDAHQMTRAELKSLFRDAYQPRTGSRSKRLVLFGEPAINAIVTDIAETEGGHFSINRIHLPRLSKDETASYLHHRLKAAGYHGKPLFSSAAVRQIFRDSGGIPLEINRFANHRFKTRYQNLTARLSHRKIFTRIKPLWAIIAVLAIGVSILVVLAHLPQPKRIKIATADSNPGGVHPPVRAARNAGNKAKQIKKSVAENPIPDSLPIHNNSMDAIIVKQSPPLEPLPAVAVVSRYRRPPLKRTRVQREAWILAQQSNAYTIQLIGVRSEQSLLAFIKGQDLPDQQPMAYYKTVYRGNGWYPLLYGVYPTAEQARKAIEHLPEPIREMNPWIRRLSAIQKAIRKHSNLASSR